MIEFKKDIPIIIDSGVTTIGQGWTKSTDPQVQGAHEFQAYFFKACISTVLLTKSKNRSYNWTCSVHPIGKRFANVYTKNQLHESAKLFVQTPSCAKYHLRPRSIFTTFPWATVDTTTPQVYLNVIGDETHGRAHLNILSRGSEFLVMPLLIEQVSI